MAFLKTIDATLRIYFIVVIVSILVINTQVVFPSFPFPKPFPKLLSWYISVFGDHLVAEKPYFLRGVLANGLFVIVPLDIANIYAITAEKSWFSTTCLIHGVTAYTSLVAILSELAGQQKAPAILYVGFTPFVVFGLLAVFRGLVPVFMKSTSNSSSIAAMKKKA